MSGVFAEDGCFDKVRSNMERWGLGLVGMGWLVVTSVFAAAPPTRYTFPANGTVRDTVTELTWQREVPSTSMNWADAKKYCADLSLAGTGWRLPTRAELLTLVDPTEADPALDRAAFTNTPVNSFWSSSAYAGSSGSAWSVEFGGGRAVYSVSSVTYRVRCVR
jgi:hypothetical protein